jgi:hypothetical protein
VTTGTIVAGDTGNFTESYASKNAGTGLTLTPAGTVTDGNSGNTYAVTFVNDITGVITARDITVTAQTNTKTYDGTITAAAIPLVTAGTIVAGDTGNFTESYASKNAGFGLILTPAGSVSDDNSGNNYAVMFVNDTTGVIAARDITVTATGQNKTYDGNTNATVTLADSRIAGDQLTDNYTSAFFSNKGPGTAIPVIVSGISIGGADAFNYTLQNTTAVTSANILSVNPEPPSPSSTENVASIITAANQSVLHLESVSGQAGISSEWFDYLQGNYAMAISSLPVEGGCISVSEDIRICERGM